jgi:electron transport complex protein RnfG
MKTGMKSVIVLTSVCLVVALLMAATNLLTAPLIRKNEESAANQALLVVMPNGKDFEKMDISSYTLPSTVTAVYKESGGGYVIELETAGYSTGMKLMCGVDAGGTVTGATCISSGETLGYEKTFGQQLVGVKADTVDAVDTIGGATKTTQAYKSAVKDALNAVIVLQGGSVDIRTEAEILADNLKEALPAGEGAFEEVFIVEVLSGVKEIYKATNGQGYVYVVGEVFVGVDANGEVVSQVDAQTKDLVGNAYTVQAQSHMTEIDTSAMELASGIVKVQKTDSGNYVFELKASGFGMNGDKWYNPSGKPITLMMAATSDGTIISVKTVEQYETDGIGSACADKSFYGQFAGKNQETYKNIDAIAGATLTTDGYKTAIGRALEAIVILEGGN